MQTKYELRKEMIARRNQLTLAEIEQRSQCIYENLLSLPQFVNAKKIFSFVSTKKEVDTSYMIIYGFSHQTEVGVPKVYGKEMHFHKITSYDDLNIGFYDILEPKEELEKITPDFHSVILMPGLLFDRTGARIGYGGGYYDKYFAEHPEGCKIAICYDFQVTSQVLPKNEHDILPDIIVTDKEIITIRRNL